MLSLTGRSLSTVAGIIRFLARPPIYRKELEMKIINGEK